MYKNLKKLNKNKSKDIDIQKLYAKYSTISANDFLSERNINKEVGLTDIQVKNNIDTYGYNEINKGKQKKWYNYFSQSLFSPFNSILIGITIVLFYTDVLISTNPSYINIIVILLLVISSTLLDFFEEYN